MIWMRLKYGLCVKTVPWKNCLFQKNIAQGESYADVRQNRYILII